MMKEEESVLLDIIGATNYTNEHKCEAVSLCPKHLDPSPTSQLLHGNLSDLSGERKWENWPENGGNQSGFFLQFSG